MRISILLTLAIVLHVTTALSEQPDFALVGSGRTAWQNPAKDVKDIQHSSAPADAIAYAVADLAKVNKDLRPFQRYIWIPDGDRKKIALISFATNLAISKSSTILKPAVVANGKLVRWNLQQLAPRIGQYTTLHALWEELAFEPYFHITKTTADAIPTNATQIDSLNSDPPGSIRFKIDGQIFYRSPSGTIFALQNNQWIQNQTIAIQRVATYGSHVGLEQGVLLQGLSQSNATVVRYDFFLAKVLSSVDGGMYYRFAGIEANPKGKTAQAAFLESVGADESLVAKLRSDQRVAIFRSNVTGKPRRIDAFYGVGVRPGSGTGLITITHDIFDNDVDPRTDPIRNLLEFKDRAREVIAEKPNGMHIFALFDANGALQNSVPDTIAKDHGVPNPHTARLQASISCIRCHGPHDGLQPFSNDVKSMLSGLLDVFGDVTSKRAVPDQLDRLAGLYSGDLSKAIRRGRDDYSDAVYIATSGMSVKNASAGIARIYNDYVYDQVDAWKACLELGYLVPKNQGVRYLNQILPPLSRDVVGISPEDPIIGALKAGLKINRQQFEQVYADAAFRAQQTRKAQENIKKR